MAKRSLALFLILLTVLPAFIYAGSLLFAPVSVFEKQDIERENAIYAALGNEKTASEQAQPLDESERYIVRFKDSAKLKSIELALNNIPYRLLAQSAQRLFAVSVKNKDFFNKNADIIDYYEPDLQRESLAITNDPIFDPVYESAGIVKAWDTVKAGSGVIVAVLDTGVDRTHEDLAGINLLPGYDAVEKTAGVNSDSVGHGTGVIGIIAAQADNGIGIAGVAHGVTVLPIKVSASSTTIYSSDLIAGIRFAADAGAKIINMSVGGYSSSFAEQEAINYAAEKGCILISAAGNGGNLPYADQKSYPASYENVISVASCNENGERSEFSQYNDAVDLAVNGESLTLPYVNELGESAYRTDSGTSYSCAIVSGIAALAVTRAGNVRFGADEFLALIIDSCGLERNDELGYGIINANEIIMLSDLPIITGVANRGRYSESVHIGFNRGTAVLDGDPFEDGEIVRATGRHTITVTDGENKKSVVFNLDYDPLSYKYKEFSAFSYFEFERGTAMLDGFPYTSGERISTTGRHKFSLSDGDETIEKTVYLQYALPAVYGIEDGGIYDTPVEIKIIGDGFAELDGKRIYGEAAVCESGVHTLTVKSGNGAVSKQYSFELNFPYATVYTMDYQNASAAIDEANGYFCLYGESLVGARIYDINSPQQYAYFLPVGTVYGHAFSEDKLILFSESGVSLIDRKTALNGAEACETLGFIGQASRYVYAEGEIYGFAEGIMRRIYTDGSYENIRKFDFDIEIAYYADGLFCLLAPSYDTLARIYDPATDTLTVFDVETSAYVNRICFDGGFLAVGSRLFDVASGEVALEFCSYSATSISNGLLYTENRIIEIASGKEIASFPYPVSDICATESGVYVFGEESALMTFIQSGTSGVAAYGAAERTDFAISPPEVINPYRTDAFYSRYYKVLSAKASENDIFFILSDKNALFAFSAEDFTEYPAVPLRYSPQEIYISGGYITVTFNNCNSVYIAPQDRAGEGMYITLPDKCDSAAVANGRLYAVLNGRIVHCQANGNNAEATSISATRIDSDGERIYALDGEVLTVYDSDLNALNSINVNAEDFVLGSGVAVGNIVYDRTLTDEFARLDTNVMAIHDNAIITEKGVYDLARQQYIGSLGAEDITAVAITQSNAVVSFGSALISVCSFGNGASVTQQPNISGVSEGNVYIESVTVEYAYGIGYLDGKPFASGSAVSGAGKHTLLISLPCAQSVLVNFTIESNIESIAFLANERNMSVGETITLRVKYLPEGASSVPVSFKCDSDGITVGEMGEITANAVGIYTVTAEAVTDYGVFRASCKITVRDDLIAFKEESGVEINRDSGFALGVAPATDTATLASMLVSQKNVTITNANGKPISGAVGTGCKLVLKNGDEITDTITIIVAGDCDGDGYITAYDLYLLERILRGYAYSAEFTAAADINRDGITADNDYRTLKNMLLRPEKNNSAVPSESLFGLSSVQTLSHIESGSIIDVAVCISGCKYARGVSGVLNITEGLEFLEAESVGWEIDAKNLGDGRISFYAHGEDGEYCEKAFKVLLNLRFRVTAKAGSTLSFSSEGFTASFKDGCKTVRFEATSCFVYSAAEGNLNIEFHNAEGFVFNPEKHEYTAVIPYNSALADISVTRPNGYAVSVSNTVIPDSGSRSISVNVIDKTGAVTLYTIRVRRDDEPRFDTNCRLAAMEIEGHKLNPQFNPDIFEYSVSVPHGTEKINLYCVAQSQSARIIIGDTSLKGETTPITVTVGSPDGEALTYTVYVTVLPPIEESIEESLPEDKTDDFPTGTVLIIIGAIIAAAAIFTVYIKLAKRDEELRNNQAQ